MLFGLYVEGVCVENGELTYPDRVFMSLMAFRTTILKSSLSSADNCLTDGSTEMKNA